MTVYSGETGGLVGLKARSALAAACDMLPRERLLLAMEDAELESWFIDSMRAGVRRCDRTVMRIYAEARRVVGQQVDLSVLIVNQIGAPVLQARAAVDSQRNVEALAKDRPAVAAKLARWLLEYSAESGEPLAAIMARASGAEVVEAPHAMGNASGANGNSALVSG